MIDFIGHVIGFNLVLGASIGLAALLGVPTVIAYIILGCAFRAAILPLAAGKRRRPLTDNEAAWIALNDIGLVIWLLVVFA